MLEDLLNRFGIVFNFAAGFLLSPQLIGIHRIQRAEQWAEDKLSRLTLALKTLSPNATTELTWVVGLGAYMALALYLVAFLILRLAFSRTSFQAIIVVSTVGVALGVLLWMFTFVRYLTRPRKGRVLPEPGRYYRGALAAGAWMASPVFFTVVPLLGVVGALLNRGRPNNASADFLRSLPLMLLAPLLYFPLRLLIDVLAFVLSKLEGDDKLLALLTSFGILLFLAGNVLQFIATFHPQ
jgi:hypothetical protein